MHCFMHALGENGLRRKTNAQEEGHLLYIERDDCSYTPMQEACTLCLLAVSCQGLCLHALSMGPGLQTSCAPSIHVCNHRNAPPAVCLLATLTA